MPKFIENTANQIFRVIADFGAQFDCVEVKRVKGGYADKAKARRVLVNKQFIIRSEA